MAKGKAPRQIGDLCYNGHPLVGDNVRISTGKHNLVCRICTRNLAQKNKEARRERDKAQRRIRRHSEKYVEGGTCIRGHSLANGNLIYLEVNGKTVPRCYNCVNGIEPTPLPVTNFDYAALFEPIPQNRISSDKVYSYRSTYFRALRRLFAEDGIWLKSITKDLRLRGICWPLNRWLKRHGIRSMKP